MTRQLLFCSACICVAAQLHAEELPKNIRRTSAEILGTIEPSIDDACVVRRFVDPYASLIGAQDRREYRWRVRVPDGSTANVMWAHGVLPKAGFPAKCRRLFPAKSPLPSSPGDIVVIVRAGNGPSKDFEISVFPEFPNNSASIQSTSVTGAGWLPYWKATAPTLVQPDDKKGNRLDPKGQQLLMKHFVDDGGTSTGFVVWLDFSGESGMTK